MFKWILLTCVCFTAAPALAQTVYVVRHAERQDDSDDTVLSATGLARAEALRHTLQDAGIKRAFVTQYVRTKQTAQPLLDHAKITPVQLQAADLAALSASLNKLGAQDSALVVGHSNTLPDLIKSLSGDKISLAHGDYDGLFVLRREGKRWTLTRLHYGAQAK